MRVYFMSLVTLLWKLDNGKALDLQETSLIVKVLDGKSQKEMIAWAKTMNVNPINMKKSLEQEIWNVNSVERN